MLWRHLKTKVKLSIVERALKVKWNKIWTFFLFQFNFSEMCSFCSI